MKARVGLTCTDKGRAPTERPALEPHWGKLAVRNPRGDDGNVGIIRSPIRAIILPDRAGLSLRGVEFSARLRAVVDPSPSGDEQVSVRQ